MDNQQKAYYIAQVTLLNVLCQPEWEGVLSEKGYIYMYHWVPSLFTWNYHIINKK